MRTSFISAINCIGVFSLIQYFYKKIPTSIIFHNWLGIALLIISFALLSALVMHQKILLTFGASGTYFFLIDLTDKIITNLFKKDISLIEDLAIGFISLMLLSILIEFVTSSNITFTNLLVDGVLSIVAIALINWLLPIIAKVTNLQLLNTWATPCILIIFFILIISLNFNANYRTESLKTESHLQNDDEQEEDDDTEV